MLGEDNGLLLRAICKKATGVTYSEARAALKRAKITIDFPVPKVPEQSTAHSTPPAPRAAPNSEVAATRKKASKEDAGTLAAPSEVSLQSLIAAGLMNVPLEVERVYKGVKLQATIEADGRVAFGGQSYDSLSAAGGMARATVIGIPPDRPYPPTNGWTFWQFREPRTGELREMGSLRSEFLASKQ